MTSKHLFSDLLANDARGRCDICSLSHATERDGGLMEVLVTIFGGLAIAFAAKKVADWKARRAFGKRTIRTWFTRRRPDGVLWPMHSLTEKFLILTSVCPVQQ